MFDPTQPADGSMVFDMESGTWGYPLPVPPVAPIPRESIVTRETGFERRLKLAQAEDKLRLERDEHAEANRQASDWLRREGGKAAVSMARMIFGLQAENEKLRAELADVQAMLRALPQE